MPHIVYPYNEILPTKRAHDVFVFNECVFFAKQGIDVTLLSGKGTSCNLFTHYNAIASSQLSLKTLPIFRRNNPLRINANLPFLFFTQRLLQKITPDIVILSVFKQGQYHLKRKIKKVKYIYEVHQLAYYPHEPFDPKKLSAEKNMLQQADLVVTTTNELTQILKKPPYELQNEIQTLPLAVNTAPLLPSEKTEFFTFAYVGQLYKEQGLLLLLEALSLSPSHYHLKVIGGKKEEIHFFKEECRKRNLNTRVTFLGFQAPADLPLALKNVNAFIAPFEAKGKMMYVAHTKLLEYADWKLPVIAPDLPIVKEYFPQNQGVIYFKPDQPFALAKALAETEINYEKYFTQISLEKRFTWEKRIENYVKFIEILCRRD